MPAAHRPHPAALAAPIIEIAAALGLEVRGRTARCFNGAAHRRGEDRTPSLAFFPDSGRFKCFGCGAAGDAIDLVRAVRGLPFREAVAWIERLAGGALSESVASPPRPRPTAGVASQVFGRLYGLAVPPDDGSPAGRYLLGRGLDPAAAASLGVRELADPARTWAALSEEFGPGPLSAAGLATRGGGFLFARHPLLFFYLDGGDPAFVQARSLAVSLTPKELRPAGLSCPLPYNRDALRRPPGEVTVCEGCIDTLSACRLGLTAVGVPGALAFRDEWFELFPRGLRVRVAFDDDEAGRRAGVELRARFRMRGFRADYCPPAHGKDVNDLLLHTQRGDRHE